MKELKNKRDPGNAGGEAVCEMRRSCGGCQTWNLTYEEELSMKMGRLIRLLGKFGHVEEILPMETPYHYRNKLQALFQYNGKNQFRYGIYQASTKHIVKCDNCLIENKEAARIVRTVAQLLTKLRIPAWDPAHKKGLFRHVMVRYAAADDSYMVVLVTASPTFAAGNDMAEEIVKKHPKVKSVIWCRNKTTRLSGSTAMGMCCTVRPPSPISWQAACSGFPPVPSTR